MLLEWSGKTAGLLADGHSMVIKRELGKIESVWCWISMTNVPIHLHDLQILWGERNIGTRPNKSSRMGGHITREYSLYICTELQGVSMDRKYVPGICMKVWSGGSRLFRIDINRWWVSIQLLCIHLPTPYISSKRVVAEWMMPMPASKSKDPWPKSRSRKNALKWLAAMAIM